MRKPLATQLEEYFAQYERFLRGGAYHSALSWLAQIAHCVKEFVSSGGERGLWLARIEGESLPPEVLRGALVEAERQLAHVRRIIEIDEAPVIEDEALLVLTVREEVDLMREFLLSRGVEVPQFDCTELDRDIARIAKMKRNRAAFDSAFAAMRRNMPLPLKTRWRAGSLDEYLSWVEASA